MFLDLEEQYDKIYRYCYFKLHHQQSAEDITQETFLRYFQRYNCKGKEETLNPIFPIQPLIFIIIFFSYSFRIKPLAIRTTN